MDTIKDLLANKTVRIVLLAIVVVIALILMILFFKKHKGVFITALLFILFGGGYIALNYYFAVSFTSQDAAKSITIDFKESDYTIIDGKKVDLYVKNIDDENLEVSQFGVQKYLFIYCKYKPVVYTYKCSDLLHTYQVKLTEYKIDNSYYYVCRYIPNDTLGYLSSYLLNSVSYKGESVEVLNNSIFKLSEKLTESISLNEHVFEQ